MRQAVLLVLGAVVLAGCASSPAPTAGPQATAMPAPAPEKAAASAPGRAPASSIPSTSVPSASPALPPGPLPAPPAEGDYKLAPKDQINVVVYGQEDLTRTLRVGESGTVTLPLLGEIQAAGLSASELEHRIESGLRGRYLVNPKVNVTVAEFQGRQFAVMGAVNQPGAYSLRTNRTTVLQALSEARGVKDSADRVAYVLRARPQPGEAQPLMVDLDALLRAGSPAQNLVVEAGDSVYVPEANTFYVAGEVEKRGAYTLRRDTTLSKALTEAGGVTKRAATGEVKVIRTLPTGGTRELGLFDVRAVMAGDKSQDIPLAAQDVVVVPASGSKVAAYGVLDFLRGLFSIGITP